MKCVAWPWLAVAALAVPKHVFGVSIWIWIAILVVVALLAFFTVSPASPDQDGGEPPPGGAG